MNRIAIHFGLKDIEALTIFLKEHERLWRVTALECGIEDPEQIPALLSNAHGAAVAARTGKAK